MLLQVEVPAEAFAARGAGEGLLVVVRVHVESQVVYLVEGFVADIALELFLAAVRQFMIFVIAYERGARSHLAWDLFQHSLSTISFKILCLFIYFLSHVHCVKSQFDKKKKL